MSEETKEEVEKPQADRIPEVPESEVIRLQDLPAQVTSVLQWLPRSEWRFLHPVVCRIPLTRNLVEVTRFFDSIWTNARHAEYRTNGRIRGAEMDEYRVRLDQAIHEILGVCVQLGRRARLSNIEKRFRGLLQRNGYSNGAKAEDAVMEGSPT